MASPTSILSFLLLLLLLLLLADLTATVGSSTEVIKMYPRQDVVAEEPKCESWKFSIDVNNAGSWNSIPRPCIDFVKDYFNSGRYTADSRSAAAFSLTFARSVEVTEGDAWIFDVDETLLSNLQFYKDNEFGLKPYNDTSFIEWVKKGSAPALPASFAVYKWVKKLGLKIFILTGRDESLRAVTEQNLIAAGYSGWEELILRTEPYNETSYNEWVETGLAPALPATLSVYKWVKKLGFKIFILTGRPTSLAAITQQNLIDAGYSGWEKLILRGPEDEGKKATVYKSEKRAEIVKQGYTIQGNTGDQWSDLIGYAVSKRSFKLPNPMYYVP